MRRKPAILVISLLLLIGVGGFYLQLRNQAPPESKEVDQFLRHFPASTGWTLARTEEGQQTLLAGPRWLNQIGFHRIKTYPRTHYIFADPKITGVVSVMVTRDSQRITEVFVLGPLSEVEKFKGHLFGQFPNLRHVYVEPKGLGHAP